MEETKDDSSSELAFPYELDYPVDFVPDSGVSPTSVRFSVGDARYRPFFNNLTIQSTAGAGDCQFWSFAQSLNAYTGIARDALQTRCDAFNLTLGAITARQLRELAFAPVLLNKPSNRYMLEFWRNDSENESLAAFLRTKSLDALDQSDVDALFTICMHSASTWGNELTLTVLERLLGVWVDVFTRDADKLAARSMPPPSTPIVYIAMRLTHMHYETVVVSVEDGYVSAWAPSEVPETIRALHRAHYTQADAPAFLRMEEAWLAAAEPVPAVTARADEDLVVAVIEWKIRARATFARPLTPNAAWSGYGNGSPLPLNYTMVSEDEDDDDDAATIQDMVPVDGGWQEPCTVPHMNVSRLQCGMLINSSSLCAPGDNALRIPFGAPIVLE